MIIARILPLFALTAVVHADPQMIKVGNTSYLKDAESYVGQAPVIAKVSPSPKPSPSQTSSPSPNATPLDATDLDEVPAGRNYPPAVIHRSSLNVGRQIPVPTQYLPPQVIQGQNSGVTAVPATPTAFRTIQTGATMASDGSGNTTFRDTELSGGVNYGSPIQTVVPVQDQQGRPIGSQTITVTPNPIIVPVTTTIEITR
jgi:hypothetical protein